MLLSQFQQDYNFYSISQIKVAILLGDPTAIQSLHYPSRFSVLPVQRINAQLSLLHFTQDPQMMARLKQMAATTKNADI